MNRSKAKQVLTDMLCHIETQNEMKFFLEQILTTAEINDLIERIRIYQKLICTEVPQRECAKSLNVSISKVTRGASNLRNPRVQDYWKFKFDKPS